MSRELQQQTIAAMDDAVHSLSSRVPPPQPVQFKDSFVFRHVEKLPNQAIVQKLSRVVSGLRAASLLNGAGLFQEQAALQRVVDEISEDVFFLSVPLITNQTTELHARYLEIFFQEDFDFSTGKPLVDGKDMVPRKKIRAYVAAQGGDNPSDHVAASKTVHKVDSGFIHAGTSQIMDSYYGNPAHFHTAGMLGTSREQEYRWYIMNYFLRSCSAFAVAANAFRLPTLQSNMRDLMDKWQKVINSYRW